MWSASANRITGCVCAVVGDGVYLNGSTVVELTQFDDCFVVVGSGRASFGANGGLWAGAGNDLLCGGDSDDRRFLGAPCNPRLTRIRDSAFLLLSHSLTCRDPLCHAHRWWRR